MYFYRSHLLMVKTLRLEEVDFEVPDISMIGIMAPIEAYFMAFQLNVTLQLAFTRTDKDLTYGNLNIPHYIYKQEEKEWLWSLIPNKLVQKDNRDAKNLFSFNQPSITYTFFKDFRQMDFILKVEGDNFLKHTHKVVSSIKQIKEVEQVQLLPEKINSKKNLIF